MNSSALDYYDHPVFRNGWIRLETPAIEALNGEVHRWLWQGITGGLIMGAARVGKTTALRSLVGRIYARDGSRIPADYISIPVRDQRTVMSVFRHLCLSVDIPVKQNDRADHLSDRFMQYVADRAAEAGCRHTVLIVDEMQRLAPHQFGPFAELHDKLYEFGIILTVIFVANDQECTNLLEIIEHPRYAHIHGRFFTQRVSFPGLTSREDVRSCLAQYDELRYPEDGPTYTAYFLPEAVEKGWQLQQLASEIWSVFREYQKSYNLDSWGMQYFTACINTLLADYLTELGVEAVNHKSIEACIEASGLIPSQVRVER